MLGRRWIRLASSGKQATVAGVRGFPDWLPEQAEVLGAIEQAFQHQSQLFGFQEIRTPVVEPQQLFRRSAQDIVAKELFEFPDRSANQVCLRPEGTLGVVRALVKESVWNKAHAPLRYFYRGPMFRYERPQLGRFRQFTQFGVECFSESDPKSDAEIIYMATQCLSQVGLHVGNHFSVVVNSLGDEESRQNYTDALTSFLSKHRDSLSDASKERLSDGRVLRILDSKDIADRNIIASSEFPKLTDHLTKQSSERFKEVLNALELLGLKQSNSSVKISETLVRGLDYYNETVFELVAEGKARELLGAQQGTILAGGRYDGLCEQLGGPKNIPSLGWAAGLERISILLKSLQIADQLVNRMKPPSMGLVVMRPADPSTKNLPEDQHAVFVMQQLRELGISVTMDYSSSSKKQLRNVASRGLRFVAIIGEDEAQEKVIQLKDFTTSLQRKVPAQTKQDFNAILSEIKQVS